jgi:hypothetical protein
MSQRELIYKSAGLKIPSSFSPMFAIAPTLLVSVGSGIQMQQNLILSVALTLGVCCGSGSSLAAEQLPTEVASLVPNHSLNSRTPIVQSITRVSSVGNAWPSFVPSPTFDPALQKLENEGGTSGKRLKGHEFDFYR